MNTQIDLQIKYKMYNVCMYNVAMGPMYCKSTVETGFEKNPTNKIQF